LIGLIKTLICLYSSSLELYSSPLDYIYIFVSILYSDFSNTNRPPGYGENPVQNVVLLKFLWY